MTTLGVLMLLLVVIVFLLFMMTRKGGGCCSSGDPGVGGGSCAPCEGQGISHGGQAGHAQGTDDIDPVCGMTVDPASDLTSKHHGRRYRFCSEHCRKSFEAEPDKYVK